MKNFFALMGITLAMLMPASADAVIEELQIRRVNDNVNVRVNVRNPGDQRQDGPVVIDLFARANSSDEWTPIRSWTDVKTLAAGARVSRDFFEENSPLLTTLAANGKFQVKAAVHAPGITRTVEKISFFSTAGQ